jgi:hypothetical protein
LYGREKVNALLGISTAPRWSGKLLRAVPSWNKTGGPEDDLTILEIRRREAPPSGV